VIVSAFAKVNLSLRVRPRDDSGYHPLRSLVQSIGWADRLTLEAAEVLDNLLGTLLNPQALEAQQNSLKIGIKTAGGNRYHTPGQGIA